ncbi:hypothetical protein AGMMS4956_17370 [Bacteroidia bacterium]|nr:hypothetical protein AGMMS4956_17370 [Bacteroidia bacterium]
MFAVPIEERMTGNSNATAKQATQRNIVDMDIPSPLYLFGKVSEINTQVTVPKEIAKEAI